MANQGSMIELQPPVPRDQSILEQLSSFAWSKGVDCFFFEGVPFSFYSGKWFAQYCKDIFEHITTPFSETKDLKFLEIGAGLGMLSKHFLDQTSLNEPLYKKTHAVVSDYSETTINDLKKRNPFKQHNDHIQFQTLDLSKSSTIKSNTYHLMTMIYVIDSLPNRHFCYKKGVLKEVFVQTLLDKAVSIWDTRTFPFKFLGYPDICDIIHNKEWDSLWHFYYQLEPHLLEVFTEEDVKEIPHLDVIRGFTDTLDATQDHYFNISLIGISAIQNLIKALPKGGGLIITDFGHHTTTDLSSEKLTSPFGSMTFYRVCFPFLYYLATASGGTVSTHPNAETFLISKGPLSKELTDYLVSQDTLSLSHSVNAIQEELDTFEGTNEEFSIKTESLLTAFPPLLKDDYFLNLSLGKHCFSRQLYSLSEQYYKKAIKNYSSIDIEGRLFLSQLYYIKNRNLTEAYQHVNNVIEQSEGYNIFFCCEFSGGRSFTQKQFMDLKNKIEKKLN